MENIIVASIVSIVAAFLIRRFYRSVIKTADTCTCGCSCNGCGQTQITVCEQPSYSDSVLPSKGQD